MSQTDFYDSLADAYDLLISWEQRLDREKPFFLRVFQESGVRTILDTACGTGKHAVAFHDWGYLVTGCDISEKMLETARRNAGERPIEFFRAGFTELPAEAGYDAVTSLGNSLPHVLTEREMERAVASMFGALKPGGVLIAHGNNYDRILARNERFMPLASARRGDAEYLFLRFFDLNEEPLTFNIVSMARESGGWEMHTASTHHMALRHHILEQALEKAGFRHTRAFGDYSGHAFDETNSDDLIVVAVKPT